MRSSALWISASLLGWGAAAEAGPDRVRDRTPSATLAYNLSQGAPVDPSEMLVVLRAADQDPAIERAARPLGCKRIRALGHQPWILYRCEPGRSLLSIFQKMEQVPGVKWLEAGYLETLEAEPNDLNGSQWYHHNQGQTLDGVRGVVDADLNSRAAWDLSTGSHNQVIMVLDVGVYGGHRDLEANMWTNPNEDCSNGIDDDHNGYIDDCHGWDYGDDDNDPDPRTLPESIPGDSCVKWHATMIAGLAGASGNNGLFMAGVNWNVSFMNWKKHRSSDCNSTTNASIAGVVYATENGANVISMSFNSSTYNATFEQALKNAEAAGIVAVSSGGNGGSNNDRLTRYPNEYDLNNKLVVVNSDNRDQIYEGSNFGPNTVDLAAPGTFVVSTSIGSPTELSFGTGSSYSAGFAAGAVSLVWSAFPLLSSTEIVQAIKEGAKKLPAMDCATTARCIRGGARLDLYGAMGVATRLAPPVLSLAELGLTELGDGDGLLEAGEQLELRPVLSNQGRGAAFTLAGDLSAAGPLTVTSTHSEFGTIPPGSSSDPSLLTPFTLSVDGGCNQDQQQPLSLALVDHFGTSFTVELPVELRCAPPVVKPEPEPEPMPSDPGPMITDPIVEDGGCQAVGGPTGLLWPLLLAGLYALQRRR